MPKVAVRQRKVRDELVLDLWLAGESVRAIGGRPDVRLSPRGVLLAVERQLQAPMNTARLEALFGPAHARSVAGDEKGAVAVRRLMAAMSGPAEAGEPGGATAVPERRQGVLTVPCGRYPCRDDVLALAQQQADAVAGGAAVDVRLDASCEYEDYVEWAFSFEAAM